MGSSAYSSQSVDTSGFVTLDTPQTITATKTFEDEQIISAAGAADGISALTIRRINNTARKIEFFPSNAELGANIQFYRDGVVYSSAVGTSQGGAVFNSSINAGFGVRDNATVGGFFRLDTRVLGSLANGSQAFVVIGVPTGGASEFTRLAVSLQTGNTLLIPSGGTLTVGPAASSTPVTGKRYGANNMAAGTTGIIADTVVASTSIIVATAGFAPLGTLYYQISAGVGFAILSTNAADAGSVSWQRITV